MNFLKKITGTNHGYTAEVAYQIIKEHIVTGNFYPGEELFEGDIASKLGISKGTVREAIDCLVKEGLIISNKYGIFVSDISLDDVEKLYNLRRVLEGYAAELALKNSSKKQILHLEEYISLSEKYLLENNIKQIFLNNTSFHNLIYEMSGDQRLQDIIIELKDSILRYRMIVLSNPYSEHTRVSISIHQKILTAFKNKDVAAVRRYVVEDIDAGKKVLIDLMRGEKRFC